MDKYTFKIYFSIDFILLPPLFILRLILRDLFDSFVLTVRKMIVKQNKLSIVSFAYM